MRSYPRVHTELCGESVPVSTGPGKRLIVVVTLFVVTATSLLGYAFWYWNQSREDLVVLNLRIEETRRQQLLLQQQLLLFMPLLLLLCHCSCCCCSRCCV